MIKLEKQLIPDSFYVAVSGGIDSIVFCHFLYKHNYPVKVFHFNNKYIEEDDKGEELTRKFADYFNLPITVSVCQDKVNLSNGVEAGCRKARVEAYIELEDNIIVAHHLDDCVESYFMNFLRGQAEYFPIPISTELTEKTKLIRPFLLTTKDDINNYANEYDLHEFIFHDPLNNSDKSMRNWARHVVLPVINDRYKGLRKVVRKKVIQEYEKDII